MQLAQATINLGQEAVEQGLPFADTISTPEVGFGNFLSGILGGVFVIAVLMVLLYLVWGGIEWISSGGDKAKTEKARERMTQAITGLIVLAASLALIMLVQNFLGVRVLNFFGSPANNSGTPAGSGPTTGGPGARVAPGANVGRR